MWRLCSAVISASLTTIQSNRSNRRAMINPRSRSVLDPESDVAGEVMLTAKDIRPDKEKSCADHTKHVDRTEYLPDRAESAGHSIERHRVPDDFLDGDQGPHE